MSQQFRVDRGEEVSSESAQSDTVTSQDLQAMKQMVHEISHSPELFYEYSPVYMKRFLSVQHMGENTDSYDGPTAPKEIPYYCQDCNSLQKNHGRSSIKKLARKLQRRRSNIPLESPLVLKGCKRISPNVSEKLMPMPFQSDDSLLPRLTQPQTFYSRSPSKLSSKLQRRRSTIPPESPLVLLEGCKHTSKKVSAKLTPMPFQSDDDDSLLSRLTQPQTFHRRSPSKLSSKLQRRRRNIPSESPPVLKGREHISPKVIAKLPPMPFQSDDTYSIDSHRANEFLSFC